MLEFGFVKFALLHAAVLDWIARNFGSWVVLDLLCLLRVHAVSTSGTSREKQPRAGVWNHT